MGRGAVTTFARARWAIAIALLAIVSACASQVPGSGRMLPLATSPSPSASPSPSGSVGPADSTTCPSIVDSAAHLAYTCLDSSLASNPASASASGFDVTMQIETETDWVAEQDSGPLDAKSGATAQSETSDIVTYLLQSGYGTSPTSAVQGKKAVSVGLSGYRQDVLITLDPAYAQSRGLTMKTELLTVVVVEVSKGVFSGLIMSVPDTKKAWWSQYDAVVASLKVV
jgi:hypothetical protein